MPAVGVMLERRRYYAAHGDAMRRTPFLAVLRYKREKGRLQSGLMIIVDDI